MGTTHTGNDCCLLDMLAKNQPEGIHLFDKSGVSYSINQIINQSIINLQPNNYATYHLMLFYTRSIRFLRFVFIVTANLLFTIFHSWFCLFV